MAAGSGLALILRADGGLRGGAGHLMRCLALAQAWQDSGGLSQMACAEAGPFRDRFQSEGILCHEVAAPPGSRDDALETARLAQEAEAAWVAVDGYHFDGEYQRTLKESGFRVLALDDFGHAGRYEADIVLNMNLGVDEKIYRERSAEGLLLLGPRYALLRREFLRRQRAEKFADGAARRILVAMGGADADNATGKVLKALGGFGVPGTEVRVAVGAANPHRTALEEMAARVPVSCKVEADAPDMSELMAWAEAAVSAGGTTCWELAYMGVPFLTVVLADNQRIVADGLAKAGAAENLGWHGDLESADIARRLESLLKSPEKRRSMGARGRELVDGQGPDRILMLLKGESLRLRPARPEDARQLWAWANDPEARRRSFSPEPISWETHAAWFDARLKDPGCRFFVAVDHEDAPVGQARFQLSGQKAEMSVSVEGGRRGKGRGTDIIRLAAEMVLRKGPTVVIEAFVKADNPASLRAFEKAGFRRAGSEVRGGCQAVRFLRGEEL
ncbi:MAG: UDP-2,4-diacetamido-2,4,6-trideoxy-beta-L-altropyranose hydrolase [Elusimicrobiota bacterium]